MKLKLLFYWQADTLLGPAAQNRVDVAETTQYSRARGGSGSAISVAALTLFMETVCVDSH